MKLRFPSLRTAIAFVIFFAAGFLAHLAIASILSHTSAAVQIEPGLRKTGDYKFTAPLFLCATYESIDFNQTSSLQRQVQKIVDSEIKAGKATSVSVYLRGFNGKWVGINENDAYAPASLLKVPLMIAYFKEAEVNPGILDKVVTYDGSFDDNKEEVFRSQHVIKPGNYKIIDLIKSMIENSDNNATRLLDANINLETLNSVYTDLGLTVPTGKGTTVQVISAKQYSYFFRILYNSTYLTPEYSEKALEFLAAPDFPQGLQSTIPANIPLAQKFGERSVFTPTGDIIERDLHDCGLIYTTNHPYLLCILTKGDNFENLTDVIQTIGKFVYQESAKISP